MSKIQKTRKKRGLIIIIIFLLIVFLCLIFHKPIIIGIFDFFEGEITTYRESGHFQLTSEIRSYDVNNSSSLTLIPIPDENITYEEVNSYNPLGGTTETYLEIAKEINKALWEEPFDDWQVSLISASWDCEYIDQGIDYLGYGFFKDAVENGKKTRFYTKIAFSPSYERIFWIKEIHQPRLFSWPSIDFDHHVPPEEVLSITENDGGEELRISVENQCSINAILKEKNWLIYYKDSDKDNVNWKLFERSVRSLDGKILK